MSFIPNRYLIGLLLRLGVILVSACPGPPGPPGPAGPPGSGGGPPYVWICTPAHFANGAGGPRADVYIHNASATTANVAVNILDKNGNNLTGATIPGSSPAATYPGEAGAATVPVSAGHTRSLNWVMPSAGGGPGLDGVTNVAVSVRVISDQPVVVGSNFQYGGNMPNQCSLAPK